MMRRGPAPVDFGADHTNFEEQAFCFDSSLQIDKAATAQTVGGVRDLEENGLQFIQDRGDSGVAGSRCG